MPAAPQINMPAAASRASSGPVRGWQLQEKDPLVRNATLKVYHEKKRKIGVKNSKMGAFSTPLKALRGIFLIIWYCIVFVLALEAVVWWNKNSHGAMMIFLGVLFVIGAANVVNRTGCRVGECTLLSEALGVFCGFILYYAYFVYPQTYADLVTYTNVAASQPATSFKDASVIMFSVDSLVDISRSLGYEDPANPDTVCVAPVIDGTMTAATEIQFWAVGMNCCLPRGSFMCDSAHSSSARDGLLLLDPSWLAPKWLQWFFPEDKNYAAYALAIREAEAEYLLSSAPKSQVRYLRWLAEPDKVIQAYQTTGVTLVWSTVSFYVVIAFILAFLGSRNQDWFSTRGEPFQRAIEEDKDQALA